MKRLFTALAKIFGVYQLYWALLNLVQMAYALSAFSLFARGPGDEDGGRQILGVILTIVYVGISLGMAWLLLTRTTWLADRLGLKEEGDLASFNEGTLFRAGMKLVGVYIVVHAIPALAKAVLDYRTFTEGLLGVELTTGILPVALQLALGVFLAVRTDRALALVAKAEQTDSRRLFLGGLGCLVLLIVLGLAVAWLHSVNYGRPWLAPRQGAEVSTVVIHKDTNTVEAGYWQSKPNWQQPTNWQGVSFSTNSAP